MPVIFAFCDNYDDWRRPQDVERQYYDEYSKFCGHYDQWFCRGIMTQSFSTNIFDWNAFIQKSFAIFDDALKKGIDVIIRAPNRSELETYSHILKSQDKKQQIIEHFYMVKEAAAGNIVAKQQVDIIQKCLAQLVNSASHLLKITDDDIFIKPHWKYVNNSEFWDYPSNLFKQAMIDAGEIREDDKFSMLGRESTTEPQGSCVPPGSQQPQQHASEHSSQHASQHASQIQGMQSHDDIDINMGVDMNNEDNQLGFEHSGSISPLQETYHQQNVHDPPSGTLGKSVIVDKLIKVINNEYDGYLYDDSQCLHKLLSTCMSIIIIILYI